jgi:hypothetical protein
MMGRDGGPKTEIGFKLSDSTNTLYAPGGNLKPLWPGNWRRAKSTAVIAASTTRHIIGPVYMAGLLMKN